MSMVAKQKTVGVIGGMGPEATVEFLRKIVAATPAQDDADHIHVLTDSNPNIPSRIAALIDGNGPDPSPVLCSMAQGLEKQGADFLAMPCNTAHHYLPAIAHAVSVPVLDMVQLSVAKLGTLSCCPKKVGMLASPAVRLVGLYERRFHAAGMHVAFPDAQHEATLLDVIRAVKAGKDSNALRQSYATVAKSLSGADALLIACTELSVLGAPTGITVPCVDALDVLVEATIQSAKV